MKISIDGTMYAFNAKNVGEYEKIHLKSDLFHRLRFNGV